MSYEIDWEPQGYFNRFWGLVSSNDAIRSVIETEAAGRFDRLHFVIDDVRSMSQSTFNLTLKPGHAPCHVHCLWSYRPC